MIRKTQPVPAATILVHRFALPAKQLSNASFETKHRLLAMFRALLS
jgi:hypothetical protein